jgi:N-methylhydantoinase A
MKQVCVPLYPGLFSALGLMMADLRYDYVQSRPGRLDSIDLAELFERYELIEKQVRLEISKENLDARSLRLQRLLDLRYQRQMSEITVRIPEALPPAQFVPTLAALFHEEHERSYGYRRQNEPIVVVNLRLQALVPASSMSFAELAQGVMEFERTAQHSEETRMAYFGPNIGECVTRILSRASLQGRCLDGPLVLEEFDTTIVVPPGWNASLDKFGNIILRPAES